MRENQLVIQDQVVLRLSDIQAKAALATARNQLILAQAQEARLIAERDLKPEIDFPPEIRSNMDDPLVQRAVSDQHAVFTNRRVSLQGQISVLEARVRGLTTEIQGLHAEQVAAQSELALIQQELAGYHDLQQKRLIQITQVLDKERERTRLEGSIGRSIADQAKAQVTISETNLNIQELRHKFQEETASAITEIRQKISDLNERMSVTTDIMRRVDIRAPVSGHVQGLMVHGIGQVIRGGEPDADRPRSRAICHRCSFRGRRY